VAEHAAFWRDELRRFLPVPVAALEDALGYVCCPVCKVLAGLPFEYFRLVSGRWPQEPELREVVTAAGGFCNPHSWRLMGMQSNATVALVFVDVLAGLAGHASVEEPVCPLCRLEQLASEALLGALLERLEEQGARQAFGELFGLCYPHWRAALRRELSPAVRAFLVEAQTASAAQLLESLRGFLGKNTVELKWTRSQDEMRAPRRALMKTGGSEGM